MTGYEIWALESGAVKQFPRGAIFAAVNDGSTAEVPFGFVVCRGEGRVVLIDCGFDTRGSGGPLAASRGVEGWRPLEEVLGSIGVAANGVTDVVLTHAHWDHAGALGSLIDAAVHIQRRELSEWIRLLDGPPSHSELLEAIDPADIARIQDLDRAGRLRLVEGDAIGFLPGIDLISAGDTHTPGSQCVVIRDRKGNRWVAAGDCVMARENLDGLVPGRYSAIAGVHGSREALFDLYDRLLAAVDGDPRRVIAVHDDATWSTGSRHPQTGLRVAQLAGPA